MERNLVLRNLHDTAPAERPSRGGCGWRTGDPLCLPVPSTVPSTPAPRCPLLSSCSACVTHRSPAFRPLLTCRLLTDTSLATVSKKAPLVPATHRAYLSTSLSDFILYIHPFPGSLPSQDTGSIWAPGKGALFGSLLCLQGLEETQ